MTVRTPPTFLQAGSHTAENTRLGLQGYYGSGTASFAGGVQAFDPGHGVTRDGSTQLEVTENGTPDMSVDVAAGSCFIRGTESASQGVYHFFNDATVNLSISAADPTNARWDLVVAQVRDAGYSGSDDDARLFVVEGTPAGSPADPTLPENCLVLARVVVGASVSSITNANITDLRTYARPWNTAWGVVAIGSRTSGQTVTSTSNVDLTGRSITFASPGLRRYRISANYSGEAQTNTDFLLYVVLTDGSNNQLQSATEKLFNTTEIVHGQLVHYTEPSAGSVTYKLRSRVTSGGDFDFGAGATAPAWLVVEDVGPA